MVSQQDTSAPKPDKHFVDATEGHSGSIMVISAPHGKCMEEFIHLLYMYPHSFSLSLFIDTRSAVWGGLMTNRAQFNGIQGVVISGRCRDLQEQWDAGFAIYSRGHSILGQSPFTKPSRLQIPLEINDPTSSSFPSTKVSPGDIVRADVDGVVVCPIDLAEKVIQLAAKGREVDGNCKEDLLKGNPVKETFAKWRGK